ncbi:hypothetical protein FS749_013197 [Ceratobasidium sp. UAMH 11750]|nr:hypothetical protein FS749_013197 [Ceratobasidium sp. UAMH 11750]
MHYSKWISGLTTASGTAMYRRESALLRTINASGIVWCIAYSPDGARIVSGSYDNTIRIWDAHTGEVIGQPLQGHTGSVNSVAYSSDGARIVSGSRDETIRVWDAHTAQMPAHPLEGDSHRANPFARWTLNDDGWVVTSEHKRLVWVPPHLRGALLRPLNTLLISRHGFVKLDFSNAKFGEEWRQCYRSS